MLQVQACVRPRSARRRCAYISQLPTLFQVRNDYFVPNVRRSLCPYVHTTKLTPKKLCSCITLFFSTGLGGVRGPSQTPRPKGLSRAVEVATYPTMTPHMPARRLTSHHKKIVLRRRHQEKLHYPHQAVWHRDMAPAALCSLQRRGATAEKRRPFPIRLCHQKAS